MYKSLNLYVECKENLQVPGDTNPPWLADNPNLRTSSLEKILQLNSAKKSPASPTSILVGSPLFFTEVNHSTLASEFSENFYKIVVSKILNKLPDRIDMTANSLKSSLFVYELNHNHQQNIQNTDIFVFCTVYILRNACKFILDWLKQHEFSPNQSKNPVAGVINSRPSDKKQLIQEINLHLVKFREVEKEAKNSKKSRPDMPAKKAPLENFSTVDDLSKILQAGQLIETTSPEKLKNWQFITETYRLTH